MDKIGCFGAGVLLLLVLMAIGGDDNSETAETILAADRACEAQTGKDCR